MHALWLPSGPGPKEPPGPPDELGRVACLGRWSLLAEFDLPKCKPPLACSHRSAGAWQRLAQAEPLVLALGVANDRMTGASLWTRAEDGGAERQLGSACGMDHTVHRTVPCVFHGGEALSQGTQLQVRAEWNTSHAVLGADVGFVLWVAHR